MIGSGAFMDTVCPTNRLFDIESDGEVVLRSRN